MAVTRADVDSWIQRYVNAWETNEPDDIAALFTEDARYFTAPHQEPWVGRDGIADGWIKRKDKPGTWTFRHRVEGIDDDVAFVRGWTTYTNEPDYSNLWVIRFAPDGSCSEFIEWWMEMDE